MKKIKILSIILVFCMLFASLTACGSKATFYSTLKEATEIEQFDYEATFSIKSHIEDTYSTENVNANVKVSGQYKSANEMSMKIDIKMDDASQYTPLTDLYIIKENAYINIKQITSFMTSLYGQTGLDFSLSGDYVKLDMKQTVEDEDVEYLENQNYENIMKDIVSIATDFLEKAAKDVKPELVTVDGDKYTFSINDENIVEFATNLEKVLNSDLEKAYDDLIAKYNNGETVSFAESLKDQKEEFISEFKNSITELKEIEFEDGDEFSATMSVELTGKKNKRVFDTTLNVIAKSTNNNLELKMTYKISENKDIKEIKTPTSVISEDEMTSLFSGLLGGLGDYD